MTVADLVAKLRGLDPGLEVICYTEDGALTGGRPGFLLLDITAVESVDGERTRLDGRPYLKLGRSGSSSRLAVLGVTADF